MADKPTKVILDCATGKATVVELSAEEIAEKEEQAALALAEEQARTEAKEQAEANKQSAISKLTALGLTETEALALVGA